MEALPVRRSRRARERRLPSSPATLLAGQLLAAGLAPGAEHVARGVRVVSAVGDEGRAGPGAGAGAGVEPGEREELRGEAEHQQPARRARGDEGAEQRELLSGADLDRLRAEPLGDGEHDAAHLVTELGAVDGAAVVSVELLEKTAS